MSATKGLSARRLTSSSTRAEQEKQLERMNRGKRGRPYRYADALMLAVKERFGLPYRQTEGFARLLGGIWGQGYSHTRRCRRQKPLNIPLGMRYDGKHPVGIAIDSTGIKAFNRGISGP